MDAAATPWRATCCAAAATCGASDPGHFPHLLCTSRSSELELRAGAGSQTLGPSVRAGARVCVCAQARVFLRVCFCARARARPMAEAGQCRGLVRAGAAAGSPPPPPPTRHRAAVRGAGPAAKLLIFIHRLCLLKPLLPPGLCLPPAATPSPAFCLEPRPVPHILGGRLPDPLRVSG